MSLNANRETFTFNHSGQVDEYGASIGDHTVVQANFDSRGQQNLDDINNVKDTLRNDYASVVESKLSKTGDFTGTVMGGLPLTSSDPISANILNAHLPDNTAHGIGIHLLDTIPHTETIAKIIYVSVATGNDTTGDGGAALPYKTIAKALSTIKKNISAAIKVRILAGNYSSEGAITVKGFKGTSLTITAFDGTNDVILPSDSYLVDSISNYDCDVVYIYGIKPSPSTTTYGIFSSNCKFVNIVGYKNTTSSTSGIGVTGNSFVWVKDSTAQNLDTVISSNQGGTVVSQNWIDSTGNSAGLVVNTGAKIHMYDDAQPTAAVLYTQGNGGVIFDKNGNPISKNVAQQVFAQKEISLAENLEITISLSQAPRWIKASACVATTALSSEGHWGENDSQFCIYTTEVNTKNGTYKLITFSNASGTVDFTVSEVAKDKITLTRTSSGTLAGNMYLNILCGI